MNRRLKKCPVCNTTLEIIEYHCPNCDTTIRGKFEVGDLASLTTSQQEFVKVFVCCQGNIKEVEKVLKISYPTVKNRLSEITLILCPKARIKEDTTSTIILAEIEQGKLSVDEAIEKLKKRR